MFTFPRASRLTTARDYQNVFRGTQTNLKAGSIRIRVRVNGLEGPRMGIVVPKKGTAKAVRRNRVKRIIRDRFRCCAGRLPGVDLVVQVFAEVDDEKLHTELERMFLHLAANLAR